MSSKLARVLVSVSFIAAPLMGGAGCSETISDKETVTRRPDGTVVRESETVKREPDGSIVVEKDKDVDR